MQRKAIDFCLPLPLRGMLQGHRIGYVRVGHTDEFEHLRGAHAQLHLAAGEILLEHESGNTPKALEMLSSNDYRRASNRVQLDIVRLMSRDKLSR